MVRPRIVAWLGLASGLDYAAQVLLPILLVRVLSAHDFGGYRLLWLAAQTCANILSMSVAGLLAAQSADAVGAADVCRRRGRGLAAAAVLRTLVGVAAVGLRRIGLSAPDRPGAVEPRAGGVANRPGGGGGVAAAQPDRCRSGADRARVSTDPGGFDLCLTAQPPRRGSRTVARCGSGASATA